MSDKRHANSVGRVDRFYFDFLISLADFSRRRAWIVVATAIALSGLCIYYTISHFAISTNMSKMLSQDLPFEQAQRKFDHVFPGLNRTILIVVRGQSAARAREDAEKLARWLRAHGRMITDVYQPGGGQFFEREGFMYLSSADLWHLSDRLSQAQPFIAALSAHPTLPSFTHLLGEVLQHEGASSSQVLPGISNVLAGFHKTITETAAGHYQEMPWGTLLSGGVSVGPKKQTFLLVKPRYDYQGMSPVQTALNSINKGIQVLHLNARHGVQVRITGSAALDNDQIRTVSQSAGLATGLSLTLVLVMLILGLRSPRFVVLILLTLFMGLTWTAAFALFATGPLNLISVAFAVLFVGLGVDFGIQFSIRYQEETARGDHAYALGATARGVGSALSLAAVAAAISFYSFVPTDYAGIVDLGIISGTSMFFALFANLTVLPALLTLFTSHTTGRPRGLLRACLARFPVHDHPRLVVAVAGAIAIGLVPVVWGTHFDFDPMHLQNQHSEAVKTFQRLLKERDISPYPIDVLEPNLATARAIAAKLSKLKVVGRVVTLDSFVPPHQAARLAVISQMSLMIPPVFVKPKLASSVSTHAIRQALSHLAVQLNTFAVTTKNSKLAKQARSLSRTIRLYVQKFGHSPQALQILQRRVIGTLPWQLHNLQVAFGATPITVQDLPKDLRVRYIAPDGEARVQVFSSLNLNHNRNISQFVRTVQTVVPDAVGPPVLLVEGGVAVVRAFRQATVLSFVLIVIVLLLTLRSVADAITILLPLGLAAMVTIAVMKIVGLSFNLANIIVLPLLIGLSVAFSIYLVVRGRGVVVPALLLDTTSSEAVVFSALTTMCSFGSLAISSNPGMAVLGETLFIAMGAALISILVLLPALLTLRKGRAI